MHGFWPIFFLLVVLKIPVFASIALIWWASKAPEPEGADEDSDGGFKRWKPGPVRPRGPHSNPYGGAMRRTRGHPAQPAPFGRSQVPLDARGSSADTVKSAELPASARG
jgi:hypothetical protein